MQTTSRQRTAVDLPAVRIDKTPKPIVVDPAVSIAAHVAASDPHIQYQKESEKDAASGYAGLNSSSRTVKGVDAGDDLVVNLATKGLVLKDTQATPHYWRITISNIGALVITDVGTVKP